MSKPCPYCKEVNPDANRHCACGYDFQGAVLLGAVCPKCGATAYRQTRPASWVAFTNDRICKGCKTRYTLPTPRWAGAVFIVIGLPLAAIGVLSLVVHLLRPDPGALLSFVVEGGIGLLGLLAIGKGLSALILGEKPTPPPPATGGPE